MPSGAVTFLFTDIEGSSRLWEQHPQMMPVALARHDAILREVITDAAGQVFKTVGDASCAAFVHPQAALLAALQGQERLLSEPWGGGMVLRVRMALHTGAAEARDGDYSGSPLNRLARLLRLAHGGQVLLSTSTAELLQDQLPSGSSLLDLGFQRLKDLARPERVYQLVAPGLSSAFPPLRGGVKPPHNLPSPPNALIGREGELAAIQALLQREGVRLLTLLGPGGIGKTRLALQVGREQLDAFLDGVWFVDLTPMRDPAQVLPSIARTLGLNERSGQPLAEQLRSYLRERALLLLLDNMEQVIDAAPELASLLAAAPLLRIITTSREALRLGGEHLYPVPPLAVQARGNADPFGSPAAKLFRARAAAARGEFTVDAAGAAVIAAICVRLDGLPLALELAAARMRLLSPQALLARLERPLDVLTVGARDLPARQQTLRTTIAWSYELLTTTEQILFRRLGVFVGGWDLTAAEVVGALGVETLDLLAALADKSLVQPTAAMSDEQRYTMLETIREYALEQLAHRDELADALERHNACYLALAEAAEPELRGPQGTAWLDRLEADHDNLRAVLGRLIAGQQAEHALRLGSVLWPFWWRRGYLREGRSQLETMLGLSGWKPEAAEHQQLRAGVLLGAGRLAIDMADYEVGRGYLEESLAHWQQLGDQRGLALALESLGQLEIDLSNYPAARAALEQSLALFQASGNAHSTARTLGMLAWITRLQGDRVAARVLAEESLRLASEVGDLYSMAMALEALGYVALASDRDQARAYFAESLALFQQLGDKQQMASTWNNLGCVELVAGDYEAAETYLLQALELRRTVDDRRGTLATRINLGNLALLQEDGARSERYHQEVLAGAQTLNYPAGICFSLEGLAGAAALAGEADRAARLLGAAAVLHSAIGLVNDPDVQLVVDRTVERTRLRLGAEAYGRAVAAGRTMPLEQALRLASRLPTTNE